MTFTKVTTEGIADSAVSTAKIGANAVDTSKIGADVIVADDIAANAITVAEISDGAVTHAKLHSAALSPITIDQSNNRVGIGVTPTTNHALTLHDTSFRQLAMTGNRPTIFMKESDGSANQNFQVRVDEGQFRIQQQNDGQTNAVTKLQITQEGYVTTPSQPMVRLRLNAHVSPSTTVNSPTKITTWQVNENIGNHWDNSNAQWTCPVAGVYEVSAFFIKYPTSGNGHVDLYKNGSMVNEVRWRVHEGGSSYHQAGGNTYISCAANDILYWTYFGGAGIHSSNGAWTIRLAG